MNQGDEMATGTRDIFDRDEVDGVLSGSFYDNGSSSSDDAPEAPKSETTTKKKKPTHYKVICISMYTDALGRLDAMVRELKSRGYTKANRSALIRHALSTVDLDSVPRGL
jgi:hypothetical protein